MEAYSKEFRRDVLAACDAGEGTRLVALRFDVSESWVRRIKQERREQGKVAPLSTRRRRKIWEPYAAVAVGEARRSVPTSISANFRPRPKQNLAGKSRT